MIEPKEPREFEISIGYEKDTVKCLNCDARTIWLAGKPIHVIEFSAYQALQSELDKVRAELESVKQNAGIANPYLVKDRLIKDLQSELAAEKAKSEKLIEALKWYADRNNWMRSYIFDTERLVPNSWADKLKSQDCAMLNCGGGRARLALAEYKGEK